MIMYDDPKFPDTNESIIDFMLSQPVIPDDIEGRYPGLRVVCVRLRSQGKTKLTPLTPCPGVDKPGYDDWMFCMGRRFSELFDRRPYAWE